MQHFVTRQENIHIHQQDEINMFLSHMIMIATMFKSLQLNQDKQKNLQRPWKSTIILSPKQALHQT